MVFGSCCYFKDNRLTGLKAKSVKIEGSQAGLITNFELTQTFIHSENESQEVHYVFANDLKICIYDITFILNDEIIKPTLQSKEEAEKTYKEAVDDGRTAVFGSNIQHGMTEFKIGNLQPETECKVVLKIAFIAQKTNEKSFFIKFPLDVYTPSGSNGCLDVNSSEFMFKLQCDKEKIAKISSNVKNFEFNETEKIFSISQKVESTNNQKSIIVNFEMSEEMKSEVLVGKQSENYNCCAITISPNLSPSTDLSNNEFVFLVDCSGSMNGQSIKKASECLEMFIRSLPSDSYFNIIQFGTRFEKLFESSVKYDEQTAKKGIEKAQTLLANFGGTNIYTPLENIFEQQNEHGQRQVFILTDGEVNDVEHVLDLISSNSNKNRCFTIGIGRGCDAGLVEGMANVSGGKSDFVQEGDSISDKVIPQLKSSIYPSLNSIEVHLEGEGNDAFEVSPFPIPNINANGSSMIFLRTKKQNDKNEIFNNGVLINGNYGNETIEIPIVDVISNHGNDSIGNCILPLFAFNILQSFERKRKINDTDKMKAVELSISSGLLCKFTGYVGMTESKQHMHHRFIASPGCRMALPMCCNACYQEVPRGDTCCNYRGSRRGGQRYGRGGRGSSQVSSIKKHRIVGCSVEDDDEADLIQSRPPSQKTSSHFNVMELMKYQEIAGYWENLVAVNNLAGINVDHIDEIKIDDKSIENKCIATLVALATLHVKAADEKNAWSMIEEKAISWLKSTLQNIDINQVIEKLENLIKSEQIDK